MLSISVLLYDTITDPLLKHFSCATLTSPSVIKQHLLCLICSYGHKLDPGMWTRTMVDINLWDVDASYGVLISGMWTRAMVD